MDDRSSRVYLRNLALVVVGCLLLLAFYIELAPMNFSGREYAVWSEQLHFARTPSQADPEILLLGDSRVRAAVIPERVSPEARSLALCGASTFDGYHVLRSYLDHHRAPRILVLSYAPYLVNDWNPGLFWNRSVKYGSHGLRDFLVLQERAERAGVSLAEGKGRYETWGLWVLHRARFPLLYLPELRNARLFLRRDANREVAGSVLASLGHGYYGWANEDAGHSAEARQDGFAPSPLVTGYLHDTIELAMRSGSTVILRAMPLNESSHRSVRPGYADQYRAWVGMLREAHPGLIASDELDSLPNDHFGDRNHVNRRGAERFSHLLRGELERLGDTQRVASTRDPVHEPRR